MDTPVLSLTSDRTHINTTYVAFKDSEREAEKKHAEASQLEQKMDEMEKSMQELEQRYVLCLSHFL